jgi:hypothetical protein
MMKFEVAIISAVLASAALAGPAFAHHGWAAYAPDKQQKVTGQIAELKWEQPHAVLWLTRDGRKIEVWLSPLQRMVDRGLQRTALTTGKTVTVEAQPNTSPDGEWKAISIEVDGKVYDLMRGPTG